MGLDDRMASTDLQLVLNRRWWRLRPLICVSRPFIKRWGWDKKRARLGRVPVERVNLLRADIAQHQWRIIGRQASPHSCTPPRLAHIFQAGDLLHSVVAHADAPYSGFAPSKHVVDVLPVL